MSGLPIWSPYCGPGATPADVLLRWNTDPVVIAAAIIAAALLARARAGPVAWAALAVAALLLLSPLCALSAALFAARTVHHVGLVAVLAPLIAWSLPVRGGGLGLATALSAAVFWAWHAPNAYAWAMSHDTVYWLMQISLILSAAWFWIAVRGAGALSAVGALLITTVQMGLLGALLALAGRALYAPHAATALLWGLTPLQDQQIAGLFMWAPAAAIYLAVALRLLARRLTPEPALP